MRKAGKLTHTILDFVEIISIGLTVFAIVYIYLGQLLEVDGNSMYPTYLDKERIVAEKISIRYKELQRGEVVIFQHPNISQKHLLIKRVVGLPGETITLRDGGVYINGNKLDEPYLESSVSTETINGGVLEEGTDYEIGTNSFFLMGDNRKASTDSRYFGAVSKDEIIGRAMLVYYPINRFKLVEQY